MSRGMSCSIGCSIVIIGVLEASRRGPRPSWYRVHADGIVELQLFAGLGSEAEDRRAPMDSGSNPVRPNSPDRRSIISTFVRITPVVQTPRIAGVGQGTVRGCVPGG